MDKQTINIKNILKFFAFITIILSIVNIMPIITGLYYHEQIKTFIQLDIIYFLVSVTILVFLKDHKVEMSTKDAILSVNFIWILIGVMYSFLFKTMVNISFSAGFFEAISGFTTTGATVFSNIEALPKTILMLRSTTHFIGGMGIIVLGVGLLSIINPAGSVTLFKSESTGIDLEKITPKIKHTAWKLWEIYLFLNIIDLLLLKIEGMSFFDAINHAFATISTGGFSTKNASLGYWDNNYWIIWTTTVFMVLSGMNFIAHFKMLKGDFSGYKSEEHKWYIAIIVFLSLSLALVHYFSSHDAFFYTLTHAFFTISSIITTTGFATVNYAQWGHLAVVFIMLAMLIGGNTGSTAGGIKIVRFIVMFKNIILQMKKHLKPNAVFSLKVNSQKLTPQIISNVSAFVFLYILTNAIITLYLYARGFDAMTSFSAAVACVGNIGPGFGQVGPVDNFGFFSWYDKIILAIGMIIGRLEFFTVLILFYFKFWKKN